MESHHPAERAATGPGPSRCTEAAMTSNPADSTHGQPREWSIGTRTLIVSRQQTSPGRADFRLSAAAPARHPAAIRRPAGRTGGDRDPRRRRPGRRNRVRRRRASVSQGAPPHVSGARSPGRTARALAAGADPGAVVEQHPSRQRLSPDPPEIPAGARPLNRVRDPVPRDSRIPAQPPGSADCQARQLRDRPQRPASAVNPGQLRAAVPRARPGPVRPATAMSIPSPSPLR
jgi:hypothetical protein